MSINRVCISGNLTRDPELRSTTGGTQVLSFGVAVNDRRKNQQTGQWEDVPNFVDCSVFGNREEALSRFLAKGSKVAIEGKLRYSSWETKEGQRRSKLEVIAEGVELMQLPHDGQQAPQGRPQQPVTGNPGPAYTAPGPDAQGAGYAATQSATAPQRVAQEPQLDLYDEDIPF